MSGLLDFLAGLAHRLLVGAFHALGPVAGWIDAVGFAARGQMDRMGVPEGAQGPVIAACWTAVVLALLWALRGWWRVGGIVVVAVVLARSFRLFPGV